MFPYLTKRREGEEGNVSSQELHFFYDSQSKPAFVEFEGERYRYVHSLQGDIIAIVDSVGNTVVEYKYDAWGKLTSTNSVANSIIGDINPFRYRGYVFDEELVLFYLYNRFYSPSAQRFLNGDSVMPQGIFGYNLYCYCSNKPVIMADSLGLEGYSVVLNVYEPASWNDGCGHYDISIISKDPDGKSWVISYGPVSVEKDDMRGRFDVYEGRVREGKKLVERLLLYDDLTEEERAIALDRIGNFTIKDNSIESKVKERYIVTKGKLRTYNKDNGPYCGFGAAEVALQIPNMLNKNKNGRRVLAALRYLCKKPRPVEDRVLTVLRRLLPKDDG